MISHTRQGIRVVTGIGSASCDILHQTGGAICYGHWVLRLDILYKTKETICNGHWILHLVISYTRQRVRFLTYDVLRTLDSASRDIIYETADTIFYGHWILGLVIPHTRQGVRYATGIGFCV